MATKNESSPHFGRCMTLREVAAEMGCTPERVRQLENRALLKLADILAARGVLASDILPENFDCSKA